jgi:hypothetical protein
VNYLAALLILCLTSSAFAASVTVEWDPNSEVDLKGYKLYSLNQPCAALGPALPLTATLGKVSTYTMTVPDTAEVVAVRMTAYDVVGNESKYSLCAEKTLLVTPPPPPPVVDLTPRIEALEAAVATLQAQRATLEADLVTLKAQRDALKAGWCALRGSSLTKDVLAERAALGGCL